MRLHRFLAFFLLASLPALAQNSQSQDSKTPAAQAPPAQQPSQPREGFVRNPFVQLPGGSSAMLPLKGSRSFKVIAPHRSGPANQAPSPRLEDPGIYIRRASGTGTFCGAIVSYNFSQGENPRLESVTTCTSADRVTTRRTEGEDEQKVIVPHLVQTK
jgi:hypothetical protein